MILVATSTPDGPFPSVACRVQNELGIAGCCAMDVLAACSGFAYVLSLADAYVASGPGGHHPGHRRRGALAGGRLDRPRHVRALADGAGAPSSSPPAGAPASGAGAWAPTAGVRQDHVRRHPARRLRRRRGHPAIAMKGPDVFKFATDIFIRRRSPCGDGGVNIDDIDLFVPHQANRRIIEAAAQRIGLPMERVMVNIDRFGNTSTATIRWRSTTRWSRTACTPATRS